MERVAYLVLFAVLLVLPVVPWRRLWARWVVPAGVLAVCVVVAAVQGSAFFVVFPAMAAVGALVAAGAASWRVRAERV